MRLAVPAEPMGPGYGHQPTGMESLDEVEQMRRIQTASTLQDPWPIQGQVFAFAMAGPREHPLTEARDGDPPAGDREDRVLPPETAPDDSPDEDSDGDDRSVYSAALANTRYLGLAPLSDSASVASSARSMFSTQQAAEARRLRAAEIPAQDNPHATATLPPQPAEVHLEARQFWFGQRVWTQQVPTEEVDRIPTREIDYHEMVAMSAYATNEVNATSLCHKEVHVGTTRPFMARAPVFDVPFGDLSTLHASALSQLWCPYKKEDLPRGEQDHQRLAALWHLLAAHPREYMETLQHLFQAAPIPARPPDTTNWRRPPAAFCDYMAGHPVRVSAKRTARSNRPREDQAPASHSDSGVPPRLPTLAEQDPVQTPEVDV